MATLAALPVAILSTMVLGTCLWPLAKARDLVGAVLLPLLCWVGLLDGSAERKMKVALLGAQADALECRAALAAKEEVRCVPHDARAVQ